MTKIKKLVIILTITLAASLFLNCSLIYKIKQLLKKNNFIDSNIAIMIYDEKVSDYVKKNEVPLGLYKLNEEKTTCASGGKILGYNSFLGTIKYDITSSDECYIYFDTIHYANDTIKRYYTAQGVAVGNGNLYLHDSTLENGANDGSYRYSGANPDNFVCFDGDDCSQEDNLYRIIGVFDNRVKLIKYVTLEDKPWNTSGNNTWQNSSLEVYLNGTYLKSLGTKTAMIDDTVWSVGGITNSNITTGTNPATTYTVEMKKSKVLTRKIGLLYAHEYGFAALKSYWQNPLDTYNSLDDSNWLWDSGWPWLITRDSSVSNLAYFIYSDGKISHYSAIGNTVSYNGRKVYPTFNLKAEATIISGNGTVTDPFIIGI